MASTLKKTSTITRIASKSINLASKLPKFASKPPNLNVRHENA
ncbi:hypothetical protein [Peribacillus sp. SI8-4]|nr:hypothetical protein [Peribacillus sp. SI8-4]